MRTVCVVWMFSKTTVRKGEANNEESFFAFVDRTVLWKHHCRNNPSNSKNPIDCQRLQLFSRKRRKNRLSAGCRPPSFMPDSPSSSSSPFR